MRAAKKQSRAAQHKAARRDRLNARGKAEVTVTFRHCDPTEALRLYGERKLTQVAMSLKRACTVHLILSVDRHRQCGEVTLKSGRLAVTAQEESRDLYSAIDLLADKVERQLKKHLAKIETRKMRTLSAGELLTIEPGDTARG